MTDAPLSSYAHAFDDLLLVILHADGTWHDYRIPLRPRKNVADVPVRTATEDGGKVIQHEGHRYLIDPKSAFSLQTWYPWSKYHWFYGIFIDRLVPKLVRVGVLFYREPSDPLHGVEIPVKPLDRLTDLSIYLDENEVQHPMPKWALLLNPATVSTFVASKVYKRAIKRNPFGMGVGVRTWVIVGVVLVILCVLLYQGGYFG